MIRHAPLTVLVGALLLVATGGENQFLGSFTPSRLSVEWLPSVRDVVWAFSGWGFCLGLVAFVVNGLLQIGFAGAAQRVMVTGEERFRDLFQDRGLWLHILVARFLTTLIVALAALPFVVLFHGPILAASVVDLDAIGWVAGVVFSLAYAPIFVYLLLGFALVAPVVAVEGKRPVDALQRSWELADGHRIQLLIYFGVLAIVGLSGVLLCGVGLLFTLPWSETARFESYLRFALPEVEGGAWVDNEAAEPGGDRSGMSADRSS